MQHEPFSPERTWADKFRNAFRGARLGVRGQRSFAVHALFAVAVIASAAAFRLSLGEWCLLVLCMAAVLAAEMFNSALEFMAKAITREHDYHLGRALDIGSGAVLIASIGASIVGLVIFINRLGLLLGWWEGIRLWGP